ncbi:hypothetical protein BCV70DRAFT_91669 [Testicularia cyperi]|uniref:Uncharacterized protein n=1 Tax=Testicularia cyperi TaxID=1882483 RepID=A0A317XTY0_9BASI|nr:hypothetical protein BCV70DRAFT_91669 [Testicularia cyperi]
MSICRTPMQISSSSRKQASSLMIHRIIRSAIHRATPIVRFVHILLVCWCYMVQGATKERSPLRGYLPCSFMAYIHKWNIPRGTNCEGYYNTLPTKHRVA